jgi:ribosomal protein S18 acetylase RimI-like enzyme
MKVACLTRKNIKDARETFLRAWSDIPEAVVPKELVTDAWDFGQRGYWTGANAWNKLVVDKEDPHKVLGVLLGEKQWRKRRLCIKYLAVAPKHQRQGVATLLLKSARDFCELEGFTCMWLHCTTGNAAGNALYKRFGFTLKKKTPIEGCEEEGHWANLWEMKFLVK